MNTITMFKNYVTVALRFLKQNKLFAGINIFGLSIALAVSFIMLLFIINELSFNTSYKNRKQIYRVLSCNVEYDITHDRTSYVLSRSIKDEFPQVKYVAPTKDMGEFSIKLNEEFIPISHAIGTDSEIFKIFDIHIAGYQENILDEPNSIVLSRKQSQKFFSGEDPIGKELIAQVDEKETVFVVKGVFDDIPVNSTLRADCFINSKWALEQLNQRFEDEDAEMSWNSRFGQTWLLLDINADVASLDEQFRRLEKKVYGENDRFDYSIQNLPDVYLGSQDIESEFQKGSMKSIRIFSAIVILIIIVAAFNYVILSTAISTSRAKEIGIRKTYGADVQSIRRQLLNESVLLSLLVLPIALFLTWISKPYVEVLFQTELLIIKSNIAFYVIIYVALTLFIGLASGLYTSSFLSRLNVIRILNNSIKTGKRKSRIRFALIVVQLVIFCFFVSSTLIIRSQYIYALETDPGYYNKDILFVDMSESSQNSVAFINTIKVYPDVISAGGAISVLPMINYYPFNIDLPQDKSKKVSVELMAVDYDFVETMGIQVLEGRSFSREFGSDEGTSYLLNEKAVDALELTNPIGQYVDVGLVIGVVKDFNLHSFRRDIPPLLIVASDNYVRQVAIHYQAGTLKSLLPLIKAEWEKVAPDQPFKYKTIDEFTKEIYSEEKNLSVIVSICALFSLLIASLGLYGLTLFVVKSQTKVIGIKKVFGSSEKLIVFSFLRSNFVMVILATILSVPPTILFMNRWLSNFSYRTNIEWWVFAVAFIVAVFVVLLTVLYHSFSASRINPVESLRNE
jgi:putative ABC transport system permease protein